MNQSFNTYAHPPDPHSMVLIWFFVVAALIGWLFGGTAISNYTGLTRGKSALLWLLAIGLAIGVGYYQLHALRNRFESTGRFENLSALQQGAALFLPMWALPFITRLYRKWIGGHLTEAEKLPGIDGVRAWLGAGNVIFAVLIPLCVWGVFGISPLPMLSLTFGALLAYPLLNLASSSAQPTPAGPVEDLSSEREKVLQLLEAGKISAADSAELLNALTHSAPPRPKPATEINPQRKMVLIGAVLLLVGFFLPWFTINPGAMVNEMAAQFQPGMSQQMPMAGNRVAQFPQFNAITPTVHVGGGDIGHGLGWWILALGVLAAVLPLFASNLDSQTQKKVMLASLGIGAVMLCYLFTNGWRYVSFGVLLALAGYGLEVVGTLKERPAVR